MRNDGDDAIANELFLDHQYRYCDDIIKKAQHAVIDIGGHLGFFSLYASLLNPTVPIYSFEPHAGNFEYLKKNLKDNHVKNVIAKNLAVSDQVGEADLLISKEDLNHSIIHAIEPTDQVQKVQCTTLERIFEKYSIQHGDLLKIDCEGAEFSIIQSTPPAIFAKVSHIFLEYHDWVPASAGKPKVDHRQLKLFLEKQGYKVVDYPNHKMRELGFLWCKK